jgi:hypothetical protein
MPIDYPRIGARSMFSFRPLPLFVCLLGLAACVTAQESRMAEALKPWLGKSVASYVAIKGDPTSSVKLADRQNAFRRVLTGEGAPGYVCTGRL